MITETIDFERDPLARKEIERYRWIESEKRGNDIGWAKAVQEWVFCYAMAWGKAQSSRKYPLKKHAF
ncbi:MAG: hypothetical protein HQL21_03625 [Candidatus Omnitrophica bacterium]|nr:hypothetical protein [Candidatus Omnitrophota bacterium]